MKVKLYIDNEVKNHVRIAESYEGRLDVLGKALEHFLKSSLKACGVNENTNFRIEVEE